MSSNKEKEKPRKTFLNYVITSRQDAIINYFIPSVTSLLLYIFLFASDTAVVFRHYKEDNPIWASLTIFMMYLPSMLSYIIIISSWELWPEMEGCGRDNFIWFMMKTLEHALFPVWAMWRYAERIFWSIEAVRSTDDKFIASAISTISAPRTIELYFFLQAFLQSLPQILLQLNILMRQNYNVSKQTADAEILSFVFNLTKLSSTIAFYHRFKTQKLAGRQYPWFKSYKMKYGQDGQDVDEVDSKQKARPISTTAGEPVPSESRRSSDFYLEPDIREVPGTLRETSILDGPQRRLYQEISEPDFNIRRVAVIKGLPEDDLAGKLVSFFWWSAFLLTRILAISAFYYFHPTGTFWLLFSHFIIVMTVLVYDVKSDDVKRAKVIFFGFLGLIYIFCIIEFKIKFKKTKFIYCGYFIFVFIQNFIMCMVWWFMDIGDLESDFWFQYIFYIVVGGTLISVTSMLLYLFVMKPKKVNVGLRKL